MESIKKRVEQTVGEIYAENGQVTAAALLDAARPADSAIHDAFEWDDARAGHEFRLMQARKWIRVVQVVYADRPERLVHVPTTVAPDTPAAEGYYKPASVVVQDVDEYRAAMAAVKKRLAAAKESYHELKRAAKDHPPPRAPNFSRADRGFALVERALAV
jgi:hypothetical protein